MDNLEKKERLADQYIQNNQRDGAIDLLFELIKDYARKKNFVKAEALRDKIMEVDELALTELVKSDEIIEAEKSEAVNPDRMKLWEKVFEGLSNSERNAIYFAMQDMKLESG
ncbi:MAG: hypothetical protein HQK66_09375, partial [Desulfamplus sp.]|nr:hypothetical protein [Desulfamplus sp.]